jgi:hypothetical protein
VLCALEICGPCVLFVCACGRMRRDSLGARLDVRGDEDEEALAEGLAVCLREAGGLEGVHLDDEEHLLFT